jgi:hypothetical protein
MRDLQAMDETKTNIESMRGVTIALVPVAGFVGFTVYQVLLLAASGTRFIGVGFLAIGALNILGRRQIGRQILRQTKSSPPFISEFWKSVGENRVRLFYLGIGIIFTVAGCILVIMGST